MSESVCEVCREAPGRAGPSGSIDLARLGNATVSLARARVPSASLLVAEPTFLLGTCHGAVTVVRGDCGLRLLGGLGRVRVCVHMVREECTAQLDMPRDAPTRSVPPARAAPPPRAPPGHR